ncbi:unnamed protein product [Fraxinus pennsylvanica]|uniref:Exocyst subunit Exo70 family protein n=1 Tax=Fraxinus pennsylvanica TaxID=56036 RepID=A0AAD1ZNI3_9LAMI|nr:unnamed protein product [Fraxinus pennsylvanica]
MALIETPRRESTTPITPRKAMATLFSFSKTNSAISSFSSQFAPPTPSHTFSESMMEEDIENVESIITKWDLRSNSFEKFTSLFQESRKEAKEFIKSVKDLRRAMHFLISQHSTSNKLVMAQKLMQIAMHRLEKEFYQILSANKEHLNPKSISSRSLHLSRSLSSNSDDEGDVRVNEIQVASDSISEVESLSALAMSDLKLIADSMISSGYGKECINIYRNIRKSIVDEALYRLGLERFTTSQINRMNPEALEHHVSKWIDAAKIAVRTLFHGERFLCDHVFTANETIRESCFSGITRDGATNLFRFPELVAKSKRWPEKVFHLMNLYETISDIWPEIESIFTYESLSAVKLQAFSSLHKLDDSIQTILSEFESSIQRNSSRALVPGGAIHPLTNSVMNYVSLLANYSGVLSDIIADSGTLPHSPFPESYFHSPSLEETPTSAVSARLAWIILVLLCKLDSKAELYNNIALSYLFLANNLQFVVEKVRTTTLKFLLGDDWLSKLDRKVKLYAANYETLAWNKVFLCLPENLPQEMSPDTIKEHFRQLNSAFDEAYRRQASWVVPDSKLRDEIKVSIARKLVPAYHEFYDTYLAILSEERNLEVLLRFSPNNLGNYLSDLFHGTVVPKISSPSPSHVSRCLP